MTKPDKINKIKILIWWEDTEVMPDEFVFTGIDKYHKKIKKLIEELYEKV